MQTDICEITLETKFLLIYQYIQAGLLSKEKAILHLPLICNMVRHSLGPCLHEGLEFGPTINQLLLQESSWQILILKHFMTVLKRGLLTKPVQTQVPTWLHPLPKRGRLLSPERGEESCLLALSGKADMTQSLGHKQSGHLWKD